MARDGQNHAIMAKYISRQSAGNGWIETHVDQVLDSSSSCVAVQKPDGSYAFEPPTVNGSLASAIQRLDVKVAFTMVSEITASVIRGISANENYLRVDLSSLRIPIVNSFDDIGQNGTKSSSSFAFVVRESNCVLVYSNAAESILQQGTIVEAQLMSLLWGSQISTGIPQSPNNGLQIPISGLQSPPTLGFQSPVTGWQSPNLGGIPPAATPGELDEKNEVYIKALKIEEPDDDEDLESVEIPKRPISHVHSIKVGLAMMLVTLTVAVALSKLLNEYMWDGDATRFALLVTVPPLSLFSLFLFIVLIGSAFQLLLPLGPALQNTKYHSAIKPKLKRHLDYELPHITIQMPVYKEGLRGVIVPTVMSLIQAIQFYEQQGGTASIYVNDDGMQAVEPELADARKHYYQMNNIGYCSRLPNMKKSAAKKSHPWWRRSKAASETTENSQPEISESQQRANDTGFVRKGKFKKASNMNYALDFSNRVEDELHRLLEQRALEIKCDVDDLSVADDDELYQVAMENILASDEGRTWAGGNVRIGEVIMIIDCDTRVPVDCLLYGALEMHESPEVAILQHGSGVMQVVHNTFENGITYFTNLVYTSIKYGVGTGDVGPFVGHNAFLRWKAIQNVAFQDPSDGLTKFWSDAHVSEDFDISLRLQMDGHIIRLATYHEGGFQEGVSLTVYDELARWEKYAYGCNELVFHPFYQWIYKGPITNLFWKFLWSNIPITSKITIVAYIATYYALASAMLLSLINYLVLGLFPENIDHFYLSSWTLFLTLVVVFNGVSSLAFSMLRHRLKERQFLPALLEACKWLPFLVLFFSGISLHCARALLCHALSINIEWSSTAKEMGPTGFFIGLDRMIKDFKYIFMILVVLTAGMIYLGNFAPWGYEIVSVTLIVPIAIQMCAHFLLPVALGLV